MSDLDEILRALGLDTAGDGARATARRWLQALLDVTDGYRPDPKLVTLFPIECAVCVGSIARDRLLGLSPPR